jgi:hypothetical protein
VQFVTGVQIRSVSAATSASFGENVTPSSQVEYGAQTESYVPDVSLTSPAAHGVQKANVLASASGLGLYWPLEHAE